MQIKEENLSPSGIFAREQVDRGGMFLSVQLRIDYV